MLIDVDHPGVPLRRQCALLGLSPSTRYYKPHHDTASDEALMRWIDRQYLDTPFYGYRRMTAALRRAGHAVNAKPLRRCSFSITYSLRGHYISCFSLDL